MTVQLTFDPAELLQDPHRKAGGFFTNNTPQTFQDVLFWIKLAQSESRYSDVGWWTGQAIEHWVRNEHPGWVTKLLNEVPDFVWDTMEKCAPYGVILKKNDLTISLRWDRTVGCDNLDRTPHSEASPLAVNFCPNFEVAVWRTTESGGRDFEPVTEDGDIQGSYVPWESLPEIVRTIEEGGELQLPSAGWIKIS